MPDFPRQYLERVVRGMMKDYAVGLGVNNVARLAAVFEDMTPALIRARAAALRAGAQGKKTSECFERIMDVLREEKMEVRVVKGQGGRGREGRKGSEERECLYFTLTPSVLFTLRTFLGPRHRRGKDKTTQSRRNCRLWKGTGNAGAVSSNASHGPGLGKVSAGGGSCGCDPALARARSTARRPSPVLHHVLIPPSPLPARLFLLAGRSRPTGWTWTTRGSLRAL